MSKFIKGLLAWSTAAAVTLSLLLAVPLAAAPADKEAAPPEKSAAPEASEPKDADKSKDEGKSKDEAKPDEATPSPEKAAEEAPPAAGGIQSGVKLKDILAEGFLIRTTVLVPADAVTRQVGEVSSDSIILTLQKETAIAVCYFTLRAYVNESLTDIASCNVFR